MKENVKDIMIHYDIPEFCAILKLRIPLEMTSSSCEFADMGYFNTHAKSSSRLPQLQGKARMSQPVS